MFPFFVLRLSWDYRDIVVNYFSETKSPIDTLSSERYKSFENERKRYCLFLSIIFTLHRSLEHTCIKWHECVAYFLFWFSFKKNSLIVELLMVCSIFASLIRYNLVRHVYWHLCIGILFATLGLSLLSLWISCCMRNWMSTFMRRWTALRMNF